MNRKGMVLLEAIISTVIISLSLTLIMQSFLSSYRSVTLQKDYTHALILIENHLSQIFFDPQTAQNNDRSQSPKKFQYQGSKSSFEKGLDKVLLDVQWPSGQKRRQVSVATLTYEQKNEKNK